MQAACSERGTRGYQDRAPPKLPPTPSLIQYARIRGARGGKAPRSCAPGPGLTAAGPDLAAAVGPLFATTFPGINQRVAATLAKDPMSYLGLRLTCDVLAPVLLGWALIKLARAAGAHANKVLSNHADKVLANSILAAAPMAMEAPTATLLPALVGVHVLRNLVAILDGLHHSHKGFLPPALDGILHQLCKVLEPLDKAILQIWLVVWIPFCAWVLLQWKDAAVALLIRRSQELEECPAIDVERLLLPASSIASWLLVALSILAMLQALNIDLQPLLAVGGFGSIIVGLATQQLLSNAASGISIFLSRPFVVGEQVMLQQGTLTITGTIENVEPMRTTVRTDEDVLITVPNKMVSDMIIHNRSPSDRPPTPHVAGRRLEFRVKVASAGLARLEDARDLVLQSLRASGAVSLDRPISAYISRFTTNGAEIIVKCTLDSPTSAQPGVKSSAVQELLLHISRELWERHDGKVALISL